MKAVVALVVSAGFALSACGQDPSEKLADRIRDVGEARSDAIEAADLNVANLSQAERDAIVANEAAAVR